MDSDYILYHAGVAARDANSSIPEASLHLDEAAQRFTDPGGNPQQTSIYRMFPASKSNTVDADDAITSLNLNVAALFAKAGNDGRLDPADKRGHYRLVGAQWMDKPTTANGVPLDHDWGGIKLLDPGLLNVSHVLSQFLLEQCNKPENLVTNPDGSQTAVCP